MNLPSFLCAQVRIAIYFNMQNPHISPFNPFPNPFAFYVEARQLASLSDENFLPVFASSNIKILPYQIASARFALRSSHLKGCILCDEGSLGKTYEALLIVAQKYYEGQENILIVLPQNLMAQWQEKLEKEFALPFSFLVDREKTGNILEDASGGIVLATYHEAIRHEEFLKLIPWNIAVFDEADFLFKPENKSVVALKNIVCHAYKLLLTPTPITISIMDIYGLIHFIDEDVLPDSEDFYKRYFRKPENYPELSAWVSKFAFRTLKSQVSQYVNFTKRVPLVLDYPLHDKEKELYILIDTYLKIPQKIAYPNMDMYQLSLMFYHSISSSPHAFSNMLNAPLERIGESNNAEKELLQNLQALSNSISISGKMQTLLTSLEKIFSHLKAQKETQKALIFAENSITRKALEEILNMYTCTTSVEDFRNKPKTQILIASDEMAKGLDIEFCPVVVNYDLLYNAVEMEQRICRCHRQGQKSDVFVLNFLSSQNLADVRILELINKRTLQFEGIFGMSDEIVGHFDESLENVLAKRRTSLAINENFSQNLLDNQADNQELVKEAESVLFTTFTPSIAKKITVSPQYIEKKVEEIQDRLWNVVKYYFTHTPQCKDYEIDEEMRLISLKENCEAPHLFYYFTGTQNKAYTGLKKYGMPKNFKPHHGRINLMSPLVKGILKEVTVAPKGIIQINTEIQNSLASIANIQEISFYAVELFDGTKYLQEYDILTGTDIKGATLPDALCRQVLHNPHISICGEGSPTSYGIALSIGASNDTLAPAIENELIKRYLKESDKELDNDLIQFKANQKKNRLEQSLVEIKTNIKILHESTANNRLEELKTQKQINILEKELKQKEQNIFFERIQIDVDAEEEINKSTVIESYTVRAKKLFYIEKNFI